MNTTSSTKAAPYVYICTHKITGKFYIGFREKNVKLGLTSDQDLPLYRTSSKIVNPDFDNFNWQIIAEFMSAEDANEFEQKLIFEHWSDPLILNKNCRYNANVQFKPTTSADCSRRGNKNGMFGKKHSDATRDKISIKSKGKSIAKDLTSGEIVGKIPTDDPRWGTGEIVGIANGRLDSNETKLRKSKGNQGKVRSDIAKEKYRIAALTKMQNGTHPSQQKLSCPHCGRVASVGNAVRHHFDNCKLLRAKSS